MKKYICIHGHFYQPPRENPWLEAIELQDTAFPYHDWNERITAECYAPNSASRILNENHEITQIVNNYQSISFNFGPTLISWIQEKHPELLKKIIEADQNSQAQFQGHGAAIAQAYNHMILPLSNTRDKYTQILWGIRHFEIYFGRKPEGLWLPETAVNLETLDIMSEVGIKFTILAPNQAKRVRKLDGLHWHNVGDKIDITMPYLQKLPSGRSIALFFYDGPTSRALAFENLLQSGNVLADRLIELCNFSRMHPQLIHIATDGETYGHHHAFGDMALAYALHYIKEQQVADITIYGQFLEHNPPTHEVEIHENSSWSCAHGIERWKSDCGCNSGGHSGWRQHWRAPLRESLDWLRDSLIPVYEEHAGKYLRDPWQARNDYIEIIHDRSPEKLADFLDKNAIRELTESEIEEVLKALEMQRHALLMYTSCGWFFDELSGIETVQVIAYAARAIQLAHSFSDTDYESQFLEHLANAPSNIPEYENGRKIYERFIKPMRLELPAVTAHYAISSIFKDYDDHTEIYCYNVERHFAQTAESGKIKLKIGAVRVSSKITRETIFTDYALIHYGDQNLLCGVRTFQDEAAYHGMEQELLNVFSQGEFLEITKLLEKYFGSSLYTLKNMFRDEQRIVINEILKLPLSEAESMYRFFYDNHASIMSYVNNLSIPLPLTLHKTIEYVINSNLKQAIHEDILNLERIEQLFALAEKFHTEFYHTEIEFLLQQQMVTVFKNFQSNPFNEELLKKLINLLEILNKINLIINPWQVQNIMYHLSMEDRIRNQADEGYKNLFRQLLQQLKMNLF
ncbi:MAG TPA: DUF3536 domain-containing protein [Gammaproteobacteria bacterium]|nr:DUF3536 domain-containing protein [Gammaproteobacteria bacterium]